VAVASADGRAAVDAVVTLRRAFDAQGANVRHERHLCQRPRPGKTLGAPSIAACGVIPQVLDDLNWTGVTMVVSWPRKTGQVAKRDSHP
jgi:hypothetical protein